MSYILFYLDYDAKRVVSRSSIHMLTLCDNMATMHNYFVNLIETSVSTYIKQVFPEYKILFRIARIF